MCVVSMIYDYYSPYHPRRLRDYDFYIWSHPTRPAPADFEWDKDKFEQLKKLFDEASKADELNKEKECAKEKEKQELLEAVEKYLRDKGLIK